MSQDTADMVADASAHGATHPQAVCCSRVNAIVCTEPTVQALHGSARPTSSMAGTPTSSTAHFLVGEETRLLLQKLFEAPREDKRTTRDIGFGHGRDRSIPDGYYDYLKVTRAWRIKPSSEIASR